jgi:putative Mg2+ transporter-C (MgtC) family protein
MLTNQEVALRVLVSLFVGLIIGFERTLWNKPAGLRTYSLVCIGSTLFMIVSAYGIQVIPLGNLLHAGDPGRIAAQIVTGIGFLGAGVIVRDRGQIKGITTAAELWVTAAFGMAIGLGLYFPTMIAVTCVFIGLYSHNLLQYLRIVPRPEAVQHETAPQEES